MISKIFIEKSVRTWYNVVIRTISEEKMNRTAIVTGGAGGIGAAVCQRLARDGINVVIAFRSSEEKAVHLAEEIRKSGGNAEAIKADVSATDDVKNLFSRTCETFGSIDVLVCNAGVAAQAVLNDVSDGDYDRLMSVNMGGVFRCCREAVPYMLKNHSGSIINISSMWGICGASCETVYSASKAAVIGFTKALAKELGPSGIRVNCIAPGVIDTGMNSHLSEDDMRVLADETPLCRIGKPEEVAAAVSFLASDDSSFVTGQTLCVDGGFAT